MQSALESKIASLVSTLQYADSAEKDFLKAHSNKSKDAAIVAALSTVADNLKELQSKHCIEVRRFVVFFLLIYNLHTVPNKVDFWIHKYVSG